MSLSSIFSFESIRTVKPCLPKTLLGVLVLGVIVELIGSRLPERWFEDPIGKEARIGFVEKQILVHYQKPAIAILGSSRTMFGITPTVLEEELGLPVHSCVNGSVLSGSPALALEMYTRNRDKLGQAQLVILGLDEWHLNARTGNHQNGGFSLTGWVDRNYRLRARFRSGLSNLLVSQNWRRSATLGLVVDENNQAWTKPKSDIHFYPEPKHCQDVIQKYYHDFAIEPAMLEPIRALAALVRDDGGRLLLLHMSNSRPYRRELLQLRPAEYDQHVAAVREVARELTVPLYLFEDPAECGLEDTSFSDMVHLRPTGAKDFTRFLAQRILADKILLLTFPLSSDGHVADQQIRSLVSATDKRFRIFEISQQLTGSRHVSNSPTSLLTRIFTIALNWLPGKRSTCASPRSRPILGVETLEDRTTPSTITSLPYTITAPGTYDLASDLYYAAITGNAITVRAEGVVIDMHGHKIWSATGASTAAIGIAADQQSYITIKNGTIQGFQFGIKLAGVARNGNQVQNMVLAQNWYFGLWVEGSNIVVANNQIINTGGCNIPNYTIPIAMHVSGANATVTGNTVRGFVWYPGITHEVVCLALDAAPNALVSGNSFMLDSYRSNSYGMWVNSTANNFSSTVNVENNYFANLQYGSAFVYAYGHMKDNQYVNVTTKWLVPASNTNTDLGGNVSTSTVTLPPPPIVSQPPPVRTGGTEAKPVVVTPAIVLRASLPTTTTVSANTSTALRVGASQPASAPSGLKVVATYRTVQVQNFARKI